jgi:hypothetical protein
LIRQGYSSGSYSSEFLTFDEDFKDAQTGHGVVSLWLAHAIAADAAFQAGQAILQFGERFENLSLMDPARPKVLSDFYPFSERNTFGRLVDKVRDTVALLLCRDCFNNNAPFQADWSRSAQMMEAGLSGLGLGISLHEAAMVIRRMSAAMPLPNHNYSVLSTVRIERALSAIDAAVARLQHEKDACYQDAAVVQTLFARLAHEGYLLAYNYGGVTLKQVEEGVPWLKEGVQWRWSTYCFKDSDEVVPELARKRGKHPSSSKHVTYCLHCRLAI